MTPEYNGTPWPNEQRAYSLAACCLHNVRHRQGGPRVSLTDDRDKVRRAMRLIEWLGAGARFAPLT